MKQKLIFVIGALLVVCAAVLIIILSTHPNTPEAPETPEGRFMSAEEMALLEASQPSWAVVQIMPSDDALHLDVFSYIYTEAEFFWWSYELWVAHGDYWRFIEAEGVISWFPIRNSVTIPMWRFHEQLGSGEYRMVLPNVERSGTVPFTLVGSFTLP